MVVDPELEAAQQIENIINELDDYYDGVGLLFEKARRSAKRYKILLIVFSIFSTILSVCGLVILTLDLKSKGLDIAMASIGLVVSISIVVTAQLRLSENDDNKAFNYLQIREEASRLAAQFRIEWASLRHAGANISDDLAKNFINRLLVAKQDIATRAHVIGIPRSEGS